MEAVMKNTLNTALAFSICTLVGCIDSTMVLGKPGENKPVEEVTVFFIDRPQCNFETIAHIRVSGGYFSLDSMIKSMRQQAASVGANGLYVLQTQQLEIKEYLGTAKAIRCLPA